MQHLEGHGATRQRSRSGGTDRIIALLQYQLALSRELNIRLRHASRTLKGRAHPRIVQLLTNLYRDLLAERSRLAERLDSLSPGCATVRAPVPGQRVFWSLFPAGDADCRAHLEALVAGYARFMRFTSGILTALTPIADPEDVRIVERFAVAGNRGLWYLEIYLEGLALRMDQNRLPRWREHAVPSDERFRPPAPHVPSPA